MARISQQGARMIFDNAEILLQRNRVEYDPTRLTQGYIRSEAALNIVNGSFHIPILANDMQNGNSFNTEQRLALQDAFVVAEIGIFFAKPSGAAATNFKLVTFDDLSVFSTANTATSLLTAYNGNLQVSINNNVVIPTWDIARHYESPMTQGGVGITAQTVFPVSQNRLSEQGFYPVEPNLVLNGAGNINVTAIFPSSLAAVEANQRIVVIFRGIKAQNVTSVN